MRRLIDGMPGCGKTTLILWLVYQVLKRIAHGENVHLTVLDAHGPLAVEVAKLVCRMGLHAKMAFDCLTDQGRVLGYNFLAGVRDELTRKRWLEAFISFAMFKRGFAGSYEHPYYRKGLTMAWKLVTYQETPDLRNLRQALRPGFTSGRLLASCTDPWTRGEFAELNTMTKMERERILAPSIRTLDDVFDGPTIRDRWHGTYDGSPILVVKGSPLIAPEVMRMHLGMVGIWCVEQGLTGDGYYENIWDEAIDLINPYVIRRMEEIRKFDVGLTLGVQSLEGLDEKPAR